MAAIFIISEKVIAPFRFMQYRYIQALLFMRMILMKRVIILVFLFAAGCSTVDKSVYVNPQMKSYNVKTVVVLPLENNNSERYKKYYPDAKKSKEWQA